jgi:hypothetical protein
LYDENGGSSFFRNISKDLPSSSFFRNVSKDLPSPTVIFTIIFLAIVAADNFHASRNTFNRVDIFVCFVFTSTNMQLVVRK